MRRFLPKSLHGQMLLSVALALLLAQTLSAVLLYRADQQRREAGLISSLAFQLVADPRFEYRTGRERNGDHAGHPSERRKVRLERALHTPILLGEMRDEEREQALRNVLADQDIAIEELVVLSRKVRADRYIMRGIEEDLPTSNRWRRDGELLLAGLRRAGEDQWLVARVPSNPPDPRNLGGLIFQTLVLYIVLVGGLAFLLRRITRPLAALTQRMARFGGRPEAGPQLDPSGPDDTRQLITAHNEMESRIAALLDEKDVMLGAIGHDLKTPLAALRVRIESVEDDTERQRMATTIEDITNSLDDILSLARVGKPSDPLERTDLSALVASVVEECEDMGQDVELLDTKRIALPLRATWLRRALRNLIGNALRYGDQARITVSREGAEAIVQITDKGPGIAASDIARMLEPFARGDSSRNRETGGAGLGLTLARAIAEQHGGTIHLSNNTDASGKVTGLLAELRLPIPD